MLEKLFDLKYFDYNKFILENSCKLGLSPEEAFVLIKVFDNYIIDRKTNITYLEKETNIQKDKIQDILAKLMEQSFYEVYIVYKNGVGDEYISVKPFFNHIKKCLEDYDENKSEITKIIEYLESELKRVLTANELEMIQAFVIEDKYDLNAVKSACELCHKKRKIISIKNISMMFAYIDNPELIKRETEIKSDQNKNLAELYKKMGR